MSGRDFWAAVGFLTRLPTPRTNAPGDFARATPWFPAAAVLVGLVVASATALGALAGPSIGALFGVVAWVLVTGALHLDGFADLTDATAASHGDPDRFMMVLKDPHIGAFGVVAVVLQLGAKFVLLDAFVRTQPTILLIAVPAAARLGPVIWSHVLPALGTGLAQGCSGAVRCWHIAVWSAVLIAVAAAAAPWLLGAFALIGGWWWYLWRKVGGVNGDCHGAGIELVETGLLALAIGFAALAGRS